MVVPTCHVFPFPTMVHSLTGVLTTQNNTDSKTYQSPKSHDFQYTLQREEGGEDNVECF